LLVCKICGHEFDGDNGSSKKFRASKDEDEEEEEEEEEEQEDYGDDDLYVLSMPQNKDKKQKTVQAVENPMDDNELESYYNRFMSVLKEQRQQTKTFSDTQLHEMISQLFHSLQYKNEQIEGK